MPEKSHKEKEQKAEEDNQKRTKLKATKKSFFRYFLSPLKNRQKVKNATTESTKFDKKKLD